MNKKDWVLAIYCDYGEENNKKVIRLSYTLESGKNSWDRFKKTFSKNGYRCWQEDKNGNVVNDSNPNSKLVVPVDAVSEDAQESGNSKKYQKKTKQEYDYTPSREEIRKECLKFRESWTERELYKRAGLDEPEKYRYRVPVCDLSGSLGELSNDSNPLI